MPASPAPLPPPRDPDGPYRVCCVCLGNICRSPIAEVVLRDQVAKAGLAGLTRNAAHAHRWDRIRINGLNIGWMDTPVEHAIQKKCHAAPDDWLAKAEQEQPFGRLIKPAEVAEFTAFLLSERSGLMTGALIDFDQHVIGAGD